MLGLAGPVFALIEAPTRGFGDPLILFSLVGGLVVFGLFILWELRTKTPMLPLGLFRLRNFTFANLETLTVYAGLSTLTFFLVLFLQQLAGYSPLRSGLATRPDHGGDVLPLGPRRAALDAARPALVHGRRAVGLRRRAASGCASSRPGSTTGRSCCRRSSSSPSACR